MDKIAIAFNYVISLWFMHDYLFLQSRQKFDLCCGLITAQLKRQLIAIPATPECSRMVTNRHSTGQGCQVAS